MPLKQGSSKAAFSHNVGAEMDAGKSQKQSLAIAYAVKRKSKKYAKGGMVQESEDTYAPQDQIEADDHFLSDEEADNSPFQEASEQSGDQEQLEASGQEIHDSNDNQQSDEDQDQARKGVLANILDKVRRRR